MDALGRLIYRKYSRGDGLSHRLQLNDPRLRFGFGGRTRRVVIGFMGIAGDTDPLQVGAQRRHLLPIDHGYLSPDARAVTDEIDVHSVFFDDFVYSLYFTGHDLV